MTCAITARVAAEAYATMIRGTCASGVAEASVITIRDTYARAAVAAFEIMTAGITVRVAAEVFGTTA